MNILVTGGAGFIGSHTVVALCKAGYQPIIIDDFRNSHPSVMDRIEQITGKKIPVHHIDATQSEQVNKSVREMGKVDGVIHFAALKSVERSVKDPLGYYRNNINSLLCILEAMQENDIKNIIFSSSATVYGDADVFPVTENSPQKPASSPYGNTKQIGEDILSDAVKSDSFPLRAIALRYFNPIGAHPSGLIGELPIGKPANLVPFLTQAAAKKREPLTIFGNDYSTPDGTGVRDYIHVVDLAQAHVAALNFLKRESSENTFDTFNVGTGRGTSVKELIDAFELVTGVEVPHVYGARRAGDIPECWAETSKIQAKMGWGAQRSISEALADAWRWEMDQK